MNQHPITFNYSVIVSHPIEPQVLLQLMVDSWALPGWSTTELHFWQVVDHLNQKLREMYDLHSFVLRCVRNAFQSETHHIDRVYQVESLDPDWVPPPYCHWVSVSELMQLSLVVSEHRNLLNDWFAFLADPGMTACVEWARPGWFAGARLWIADRLAERNQVLVGPITQVRAWERSSIMRASTSGGNVYFKAVPPMFGHEPALTHALALHDPDQFPEVLAIDPERGWMLTADFGEVSLNRQTDLAHWEEALHRFANIQILYAERIDELTSLRCPTWTLENLATTIDPLFEAMGSAPPEQRGTLSLDAIELLHALGPELKVCCAQLAAFKLPLSLEHGDLWPTNIFLQDRAQYQRYTFTDFSDSTVAHPFFSPLLLLDEARNQFPNHPNVQDQLCDAYLLPWSKRYPERNLKQAFALAQRLAPLHQAVLYFCSILPQMHVRWELQGMLSFYLNMLLRHSS